MGVAGFWSRVGAFVLDGFIFTAVLLIVNLLAGRWLAHLGLWAYLVDLAIGWLYFGLLNSRLTGGRTPGKRAVGIQVVARDGKPIPVGRGLARGALLALAGPGRFGLPQGGLESLGMLSGSPAMMMALSFVVGALGFGLLFFYVLNTTTRQSLHDLAAGTYVVRYGLTPPLSARPPILRLALAYLLIIAIAGGVTLYSWPLVREKVAEYNRLATALSRIDGFLHLKTLEFKNDGIEVDVIWKPGQMAGPVERDVARTVIAQYPNLEPGKQLKISVGYGFGRMVKWFQSTSRQMRVEAWKKELGL